MLISAKILSFFLVFFAVARYMRKNIQNVFLVYKDENKRVQWLVNGIWYMVKKTIINVVFLYTGSKPKTYLNIILIHTLELDHVDSNYCSILTFYKKLFYNKTFFILYFFLLSIRRKKYPISLIRSMIDPSLKREFSLVYDSLCSDWLVKKKDEC